MRYSTDNPIDRTSGDGSDVLHRPNGEPEGSGGSGAVFAMALLAASISETALKRTPCVVDTIFDGITHTAIGDRAG
jgi:hypothetical protein